ncbi:MAG: metallophosphoesterase [Rhodospirillales bacterium]|nr:metallophosphoesterase [Rhodospirillales bacterium]
MPDKAFKDLGALDGPVLVFGGPYGNFQATTALLDKAREMDIAPGNIICTGDVVAYCGEPQNTVDAIRSAGIHVVMGNCEESLGFDLQDCGCGFDEGSDCDVLSQQWFAHASTALDDDAKKWMACLPRGLTFTMNARRMAVIHGSADEIGRFIFRSTPAVDKHRDINALGVDGVIGGHCGLPFSDDVDGRIWHNPGVIGMPANDATPRTWFSVLKAGAGGIDFTRHPLAYDHLEAAKRMRQANLPEPYMQALQSGLWPNMDVLPAAEQAQKGQPLSNDNYFWIKE